MTGGRCLRCGRPGSPLQHRKALHRAVRERWSKMAPWGERCGPVLWESAALDSGLGQVNAWDTVRERLGSVLQWALCLARSRRAWSRSLRTE
jgi:hypothetical protein